MVKCIITGLEATNYFTANKKHYAFCCTGCINSIVNKIVSKDKKVKKIVLSKSQVKGLVKVKLSASQKQKLKPSKKTKKVSGSHKKPTKRSSSSKKGKGKSKPKRGTKVKRGGASTVGYTFSLKNSNVFSNYPEVIKNKGCNSYMKNSNEFN